MRRSVSPTLQTLEGRALLSGVAAAARHPAADVLGAPRSAGARSLVGRLDGGYGSNVSKGISRFVLFGAEGRLRPIGRVDASAELYPAGRPIDIDLKAGRRRLTIRLSQDPRGLFVEPPGDQVPGALEPVVALPLTRLPIRYAIARGRAAFPNLRPTGTVLYTADPDPTDGGRGGAISLHFIPGRG